MSGLLTRLREGRSERRRPHGAAAAASTTEESVAATAIELATARGLHAVTVDAVAAELGVARQAVLRSAGSDSGLRTIAFQRLVSGELAEVKRSVLAHSGVVPQLRAIARLLAEPVRPETTAAWLEGWSLGRHDPRLAAVVRGEMEAWEVFIASVIRRAVREGAALPVDPDFVAGQLIGIIDSVNAYSLVGYGTELDRARLVGSVIEHELGVSLAAAPAGSSA